MPLIPLTPQSTPFQATMPKDAGNAHISTGHLNATYQDHTRALPWRPLRG